MKYFRRVLRVFPTYFRTRLNLLMIGVGGETATVGKLKCAADGNVFCSETLAFFKLSISLIPFVRKKRGLRCCQTILLGPRYLYHINVIYLQEI